MNQKSLKINNFELKLTQKAKKLSTQIDFLLIYHVIFIKFIQTNIFKNKNKLTLKSIIKKIKSIPVYPSL